MSVVVQGKAFKPDGSPDVRALITFDLYGADPDVGFIGSLDTEIIGRASTRPNASTGVWSVTLTANALITPGSTTYKVTVKPGDGARTAFYISVPNGAGPYWIGDILVDDPTLTTSTSSAPYVNMKTEFGAVGDGTTDDTAAFTAALAYLATFTADSSARIQAKPALYVPAGNYVITSSLAVGFRSLTIFGDGPQNSMLNFQGSSGAVFELGVFSTTPSFYGGSAQGSEFRNLGFITGPGDIRSDHGSPEGSRVGYGIRDNGSGSCVVRDCFFGGFAIGVCLAYGGDFDLVDGCAFDNCDVGMYAAISSKQTSVRSATFYNCVDGLVLMRMGEFKVRDSYFVNNLTSDVTVESTPHRLGVTNSSASTNQQAITIDGCWFESQAGGLNTRNVPRHVYINSASETYKWIRISDSWQESQVLTTGKAFVEIVNGDRIFIERVLIEGVGLDYLVKRPSGKQVLVEDAELANGAAYGTSLCNDYTSAGLVIRSRLDQSATAAPSTGYHSKGNIVANAGASRGQPMGWICTTGGGTGTFVYDTLANVP